MHYAKNLEPKPNNFVVYKSLELQLHTGILNC